MKRKAAGKNHSPPPPPLVKGTTPAKKNKTRTCCEHPIRTGEMRALESNENVEKSTSQEPNTRKPNEKGSHALVPRVRKRSE